ncbi:MAG: glycogen/starch/alpha-glucan phosphorylase [Acidobacteria bacterium]|nr:glycogen/starch/alpha-glucan phosphorylase [Acidobacteriota bacterium]
MREQRMTLTEGAPLSASDLVAKFRRQMTYGAAKDRFTRSDNDLYLALSFALREWIIDRWFATQRRIYETDAKRVYYLSLEFLTGRLLYSNVLALQAEDEVRSALDSFGIDFDLLRQLEPDPALGNGGLGRLAACITESAATLGLPFYGYGIRYEYGIFRQMIVNGAQQEAPDPWLARGNPWEIPRTDILMPVRFFGRVQYERSGTGDRFRWVDAETVYAMPFDMPIVGFGSGVVSTLRLWSARASREFDLARFNAGEYVRAVEEKTATENISRVLYPADDQYVGKELRLKQQYFFVTATLQDVIRRFRRVPGRVWDELPQKVAIQLNDTHPAIAIPEMMRILMDDYGLSWDRAWEITEKSFAYTNHTVLPEALETWEFELMQRLLPRHMQIIEEIDRRVKLKARSIEGTTSSFVEDVAILDGRSRAVRMANLAFAGSHRVNGVARLHTEILEERVFSHFTRLFPGRLTPITNGITPRRWLYKANPLLATLLTEHLGPEWVTDLSKIAGIAELADSKEFRSRWQAVKMANKAKLLDWLEETHGIRAPGVDANTWLFDIQIKRIHEYKRQLMNVLAVLASYHRIRSGEIPAVPRLVVFGGKAAPGYDTAKLIIRLINSIGALIERDPEVSRHLRIIYVPDYRVTAAEMLFPACELSEQTSTAGMEASGTGNMKAALNGALTIGTLDGANVEILERVGQDNIFIFGHDAAAIERMRNEGYDPSEWIGRSPDLKRALSTLRDEELEPAQPGLFRPLADQLAMSDRYFVCADFEMYLDARRAADQQYLDQDEWTRKSIINSSSMGYFSSDRTVRDYAREIWDVEPLYD